MNLSESEGKRMVIEMRSRLKRYCPPDVLLHNFFSVDYTYFLSEHLQTLVKNLWNVIQHILMEKKELVGLGGGEERLG